MCHLPRLSFTNRQNWPKSIVKPDTLTTDTQRKSTLNEWHCLALAQPSRIPLMVCTLPFAAMKPPEMISHRSLLFCILLSYFPLSAQDIPVPSTGAERKESFARRLAKREATPFGQLPFESIGPTVCSGRVVDVDINPSRPQEMYVAYASGGVWYSDNNGTSFTPVFDHQAAITIGDIAVNWNAGIIWVGTGENNSSRSSYSGMGIYKSSDKGKTWKHCGLEESHHIGRIILHPVNANMVYVACLGALYSDNPNRGVYSTSDGGATWKQSLYVSPTAGAIDLVMDPANPNHLYAATWDRSRRAWNFVESGPGSGIYASYDAGRTWKLMTTENSGFPTGQGTGRIGLDITRIKNQSVLYAVVDNQNERPDEPSGEYTLTKTELMAISVDSFLHLNNSLITAYLEDQGFPEKYTADTIKTLVKNGTIKPSTLVEYTQDANNRLFDTKVIGTEIYKSLDGGMTWTKTHEGYLDNVFYTYGYYFGQIRTSKMDPQKLYILGVPILKSSDGGSTWTSIGGDNMHGDHHALWVSPRQAGHLVSGNDGGINISYDDGAHWIKCNTPAVGQFYSVCVDMAKPYNVYGGLQDNGVWAGPSTYSPNTAWQSSGDYPFKEIMGGDGMQVAVDPRDNNTVYTGFQFGNYYRTTRNSQEEAVRITPIHELGERPYRWNWESPIHLSVHQPDILYMGAERVFRSFDRGKTFKAISGDLTHGPVAGDVVYGTIVSLHESPRIFGVIYAGSDDGYIHVTRDGGSTWQRISDPLPQHLWVSCIQASQFADGRVYITLNGYRQDHFESYVYVSEDYGAHWNRLANDLPAEPVNVIREDPFHENVLYVGTDNGLYVSLDQGQHMMTLGQMPDVAVHDLAIQSRDQEIIVATHGRSLYKADISLVGKLKYDMGDTLTCFETNNTIRYRTNWGSRSSSWTEYYEPSVTIPVYSSRDGQGQLNVYSDSLLVFQKPITISKGLGYYTYNLDLDESRAKMLREDQVSKDKAYTWKEVKSKNGKYYLLPGTYKMRIQIGQLQSEAKLEIKGEE